MPSQARTGVDTCGADAPARVVFNGVALERGARRLFEGLHLKLTEKRIGLIGNNGSGKSSLLRLIIGLLAPDAGTVETCGLDSVRDRARIPAVTGFLFQNPDHQIIFPTAGEEIAFSFRNRGSNARQAMASARALLAQFGCEDWFGHPVHELSDGQRQRLCILAVLAGEPRLLLLDEPFASLDLPTRIALMSELDELPQQLIMASHDLDLMAGFDRIIWLEDGHVLRDGPAAEIVAAYRANVMPGSSGGRRIA